MKMIKKGLAVAVILLFIGVAFASSINAVDDPVPDLDCDGDLYWVDVEPGSVITGNFIVENIGESLSELDWEIESYPDWGVWTFDPNHGENLAPEDGVLTVTVEVVLPDEIEDDLVGEVLIVNLENSSDYCIIDAWIRVKSIDDATPIEFKLQRIKDLVQSIDLLEIIVNPDAVVDTLEEISSILEEEDVRNYIEKSSDEDCGCGDDSSDLGWMFPTICMLLYFPFSFIIIIVIASRGTFGLAILAIFGVIGSLFNCFWY